MHEKRPLINCGARWGEKKKFLVFYGANPVPYKIIGLLVIVEPDAGYKQQLRAAVEHWPGAARPRTSSYMRGARIDSEADRQRRPSNPVFELKADEAKFTTNYLVSYQVNSNNAQVKGKKL